MNNYKIYIDKINWLINTKIETELSFRSILQELIQDIGKDIISINEPKRKNFGTPDLIITKETNTNITIGYIETKKPSVDLNKAEKSEQIQRYLKNLDNFILTNYIEFRWYVRNQLRLNVKLKQSSHSNNHYNFLEIQKLFSLFFTQEIQKINSAEELAKAMANKTSLIRTSIESIFQSNNQSPLLRDLFTVFKEVLLQGLSIKEFANIFSQTLAYGLFTARIYHNSSDPFLLNEASRKIPKINPFLRKFFSAITDNELYDEPYYTYVNDLTQLLGNTNMEEIVKKLTKSGKNDPVIHFYETYLSELDPNLREKLGVYYTPEPVVSYIVNSIDQLLKMEFKLEKGLADNSNINDNQISKVMVLDPACGTGTFLHKVFNVIYNYYKTNNNIGMWKEDLNKYFLKSVFGFEYQMAPYIISHLKLGLQLQEFENQNLQYHKDLDDRIGIYLTNTLDLDTKSQTILLGKYITDEANAAVEIKSELPIMVVLGNPPYRSKSSNNSNWIINLIDDYYNIDGERFKEKNSKWLQDDYVKFIRFAQWRIEKSGAGILGFITNHSYLDNPTFRGMRQQLLKTFTDIYIVDLHGNVKTKNKPINIDENVFDIQQGVAIGIFVKNPANNNDCKIHLVNIWGTRQEKYNWLKSNDIFSPNWKSIKPSSPLYLFNWEDKELENEYNKGWSIIDIFLTSSSGFVTGKDQLVIDTNIDSLIAKIKHFYDQSIDDSIIKERYFSKNTSETIIKNIRNNLISKEDINTFYLNCLYRPFDIRPIFFHSKLIERPRKLMKSMLNIPNNIALITARSNKSLVPDHFLVTNLISELKCGEASTGSSIYPLFVLDKKNKNQLNINNSFIKEIEQKIGMSFSLYESDLDKDIFNAIDILAYIYAIFYTPSFRNRYVALFKTQYPRITITTNKQLFIRLILIGKNLIDLHLLDPALIDVGTISFPIPGSNIIESGFPKYFAPGEYDVISKETAKEGRIYINKGKNEINGQYFEGIPKEVWEFSIGGYKICKRWIEWRNKRNIYNSDIDHYKKILYSIKETIKYMNELDKLIPKFPIT